MFEGHTPRRATIGPASVGAVRALAVLALTLVLGGCGVLSRTLPSSGPSLNEVRETERLAPAGEFVSVVDIDAAVARKVLATQPRALFSQSFGGAAPTADFRIGSGDVLEVSIWEAPPAALFSTGSLDPRLGTATARPAALPEQMVSVQGTINVPFLGSVRAAGRTPDEIERDIVQGLKSKANQPQAIVRVTRNATMYVTVIGEVTGSTRMPLTARGERLLDAVASAGGVKQQVGKITLQVTRGDRVLAMPLASVIEDPRQNIVLQAGDVVTALFQPLSFTVLGATRQNQEINFEAQGITLAQALGRAGGLSDERADARAVFLFRLEDPAALPEGVLRADRVRATPDGRVPVIYRVDLKDPASFFAAQAFPVHDHDVLYVANAPAAELQKFLNILSSVIVPAVTVKQVTQ
jgi:polysaccharide export outer membrane protein